MLNLVGAEHTQIERVGNGSAYTRVVVAKQCRYHARYTHIDILLVIQVIDIRAIAAGHGEWTRKRWVHTYSHHHTHTVGEDSTRSCSILAAVKQALRAGRKQRPARTTFGHNGDRFCLLVPDFTHCKISPQLLQVKVSGYTRIAKLSDCWATGCCCPRVQGAGARGGAKFGLFVPNETPDGQSGTGRYSQGWPSLRFADRSGPAAGIRATLRPSRARAIRRRAGAGWGLAPHRWRPSNGEYREESWDRHGVCPVRGCRRGWVGRGHNGHSDQDAG